MRRGPRRGVTIVLPVYKRLEYLPNALACVASQDHPDIELIVSDNGENGRAVQDIVERHYGRPFVFRQNRVSVPVVDHFNQLFDAATKPYVTLLCDDDEISSNFASELAQLLDENPRANVALARPELIQGSGVQPVRGAWPVGPLSGEAFLLAYTAKELRLASTVTHLARTEHVRRCGKYAQLPRALYSDNLLLTKLSLTGLVAFAPTAAFRWRVDEASTGFSASHTEVAGACRGFMRALDRDPQLLAYAAAHPGQWADLKPRLAQHCAQWYFYRWRDRYSKKLSRLQWIRAAFALPYVPTYYADVAATFTEGLKSRLKARWPLLHTAYGAMKRSEHL